jgi:hypothetical protein
LALLSNEADDTIPFFGELNRIGLLVDNLMQDIAEAFFTVPTAFYKDVLI